MKKGFLFGFIFGVIAATFIFKERKYVAYDNGLFDDEYEDEYDEYLKEKLGDLYV